MSRKQYPLDISDHAVIRYLERFYHLDLLKIKEEMVPLEKVDLIHKIGMKNGKIRCGEYVIVLKNGIVVTILDKEMANPFKYLK